MVTLPLTLLMLAGVSVFAQPRLHRDPGGRFSVPIPAGWTATPAGESVVLTAGGAYTLITVVEGGGAEPRRVAQFTDQFGRQWTEYKRIQTGAETLGGRTGAFALYSGKNPKGVDAIVKAISAPAGSAAHVVVFSCPVAEWDQRKAAMETIERGFAFGAGGPSTAAPAAPRTTPGVPAAPIPAAVTPPRAGMPATPAAPTAARALPNGFKVAARHGATGQALTASFTGGKSARATFSGIFKFASSYFDSRPQLRAAFSDQQDREIQGFFHATHQGVPVRGVMVVTVDGANGYVGLLFDRPELFSQSMPVLSKQMAASLPRSPAPAGGGGAPRRIEQLQRQNLLDGSGWISLPAGWRITGSFKGVVDAAGPAGQLVSLGGYTVGYTNPLPGTPANLLTGPYRGPLQALPAYLDTQLQRVISRGISRYEMIEHAPIPYQGGQGAYILFKLTSQGKSQTGLAMVCTAPVDNLQWYYYNSIVSAPSERFEQDLPTMWEIWKSWSVNPAVFRERMDAAMRSMRETTRILQETNENTRRTYDNVNHAWSQVIRGVTTVENVVTRTRTDVDTNVVNRVVEDLNAQGYNYRVVPIGELVW